MMPAPQQQARMQMSLTMPEQARQTYQPQRGRMHQTGMSRPLQLPTEGSWTLRKAVCQWGNPLTTWQCS